MKIVTIVGARPQFVKVSPVSKELRKRHKEILVHTGQHYDYNMSKVFFEEMGLPKPDYNLGINSLEQTEQIGKMICEIGKILNIHKPQAVIVYGDTNSTLSGVIAANKSNIKIAHIEAGLRSFDKSMPEEINRIVTDHCSDLLFCPTKISVENLKNEGLVNGVFQTGDVMYDAILNLQKSMSSKILSKLKIKPNEYILATIHRQSNTDSEENLKEILNAFKESDEKIVFPIHPRTKNSLKKFGLSCEYPNVKVIDPLGYLEIVELEKNAKKIVTDSGGLQKEAFFLGVPCITLRENTEWVETIENGWNVLVGANREKIINAIRDFHPTKKRENYYGDGTAAKKICEIIEREVI